MFDSQQRKSYAQCNKHCLWRNRKGQALVEVALVMVFVLMPLTFGIIDFGRAFYIKNTLTNAARQGARLAAVLPWTSIQATNPNPIYTAVVNAISFDTTNILQVTTEPGPGGSLTVTATLQFTPITGNIIPVFKNITTLTGKASMHYEL